MGSIAHILLRGGEFMSCGDIIAIFALFISAVGVFVSVIIYLNTVNHQKKILTIQEFSKIRERYPDVSPNVTSDDNRLEYLKDMERFCVGIHNNIYDIEIVRDMSGHRLIKQYDSYMKDFVQSRRKISSTFLAYERYEETIEKLKKS